MAAKGCGTRVLVGGTFACDAALAQPLQVLLKEAVYGVEVSVEWLGYGSAADLSSLDEPLRRNDVDMVVLLVRLNDLHAAHPELTTETTSNGCGGQWKTQLLAYDQRSDASPPPLVILFCPAPPTSNQRQEEEDLSAFIRPLRNVSCRPSSELTDRFADASDWYNALGDKREHAPFTQSMCNTLAWCCARQICRLFRQPQHQKKVIVLDCDNTLWGGAVADVGVHGVELSHRFLALQRFVAQQQQRGILLCLCSKNIAADVDAVFSQRTADLVLQSKHIVVSKANWLAKSHNIRQIAAELSLGLDAFVFIDDNAIECHEVVSALPSVTVIHLPEDFNQHFLKTHWIFDTPLSHRESTTTAEDLDRTDMYRQNARRHQLQHAAPSQAAFLSSLGVRIQFERVIDASSSAYARVLQLHKRTNTFNATTSYSRALTNDALAQYVASSKTHFVMTSTVTDRYGHYGLVCATLFRHLKQTKTVRVDSFIMSCRALNRGVEHAMVNKVAEIARQFGATVVEVAWEPTVRNDPARVFFASLSCTAFVLENGDVVYTREEKTQHSAVEKGVWRMGTSDAMRISFLKCAEDAVAKQRPVSWRKRLTGWLTRLVQWLSQRMRLSWLWRLITWLFNRKKRLAINTQGLVGLPTAKLHTQQLLDDFVALHLAKAKDGERSHPNAAASESDESFRLRVRHDTKLLLLDHVSSDTPRVVWAPNRSDDIHLDDAEDDNDSDPTVSMAPSREQLHQFHRPCATPSCSTQVYWENQCAFQCCRTCCYRVQRLLSRATNGQLHAKARTHARQSLVEDFNVTIPVTEARLDWCGAHRNDSRRK